MTVTATALAVRHVLPGFRSEPLASYLAGLGLIRVLGEQADPAATAAWTPDGLAITTTVDDIAAWLADHYEPTPVLSPWNNGSGFGPKDKEPLKALEALLAHPSPRLAALRQAIPLAREVARTARERGWLTDSGGGDKRRVVLECRNRCPDAMVSWIDATVVLSGQVDVSFPPLLGSGGNDGRLDFSTNFHQRLLDVFGTTGPQRARALAAARDLLAGTEAEPLTGAAIGQFDPGAAGGPGSSRFGAAASLVNPWEYILLVEGALMFASSAVRRTQQYGPGEKGAAVPFTVLSSPDGTATGAAGEESRGELWAPAWRRNFTLPEIRQLFGEARASWNGRPARRAVDFYAAAHSLGVARGIDTFTRYGLQRRNGLAFTAVPLDRVLVERQPGIELAAQVEDWASWISGNDASAALRRAKHRFDAAHLAFARDGGALPLARMLAALTGLEQAVGRSGRARAAIPVRRPPPAQKFLHFLASGPVSAELRLAVGLASCATRPEPGASEQARSLRQMLLPVDPLKPSERDRSRGWRDSPLVPGFGLRPLPQVLADVLAWRSRTAAAEDHRQQFRGVPTFRHGIPVPAADLHDFAQGWLAETTLDLWLRACLALDWSSARHHWKPAEPALPVPTLALLHPLALGLTSAEARKAAAVAARTEAASGEQDREPRLALRPDWAARLAVGQIHAVHAEAALRLRQAGWNASPAPFGGSASDGTRIAAALVSRCLNPWPVLRRVAVPAGNDDENPETQPTLSTLEEQS